MATEFTFNDLINSGSAIAASPIEREVFDQIISIINENFGLDIHASDEAFQLLEDRIRLVAGKYWDKDSVERKVVREKLERLATQVRHVKDQLAPARGGLHDNADFEVVVFLARVIGMAHPDPLARPIQQIETMLDVIERLDRYCDQALATLAHLPAKKGQRGLRWHDDFVALMVEVAGLLGIAVSTAGDRMGEDDESPYITPFTELVRNAEVFMPDYGAHSNSFAACAKRIDRSLSRLEGVTRQNAKKS